MLLNAEMRNPCNGGVISLKLVYKTLKLVALPLRLNVNTINPITNPSPQAMRCCQPINERAKPNTLHLTFNMNVCAFHGIASEKANCRLSQAYH